MIYAHGARRMQLSQHRKVRNPPGSKPQWSWQPKLPPVDWEELAFGETWGIFAKSVEQLKRAWKAHSAFLKRTRPELVRPHRHATMPIACVPVSGLEPLDGALSHAPSASLARPRSRLGAR